MTPIILVLLAIFSILILSLRAQVAERALIVVLIVSLAVLPRTVLTIGEADPSHVGIAPSAFTLMTYHVVIVLAVIFYKFRRHVQLSIPRAHIAFLVVLLLFIIVIWGGDARQWSGAGHYLFAVLCWPLGVAIASFAKDAESNQLFLARLIISVLLFELALSFMQLAGVSLPIQLTAGSESVLVGTERVIGTLGNPANLSKVSFLLMVLVLPLAASSSPRVRRVVYAAAIVAILLSTLTISRANVAATVATVGIWLAFAPSRSSLGQRFLILVGMAGVLLATASSTVQRYLVDPEGSIRPELTAGALEQLGRTFWEGVGINSYVEVVGKTHALTASGFPVHNAFLLALAELGPILALLLFAPLVMLAARAFFRAFNSTRKDGASVALFAATPGLVVIFATGYGILGTFLFPLVLMVCGTLSGLMVTPHTHRTTADSGDNGSVESRPRPL